MRGAEGICVDGFGESSCVIRRHSVWIVRLDRAGGETIGYLSFPIPTI